MKKFSPAFLTAIALSLTGFANLGFAERYETVIVKTDDTASMNHASAVTYLKSSACISPEVLQIPEGEVAYVFAAGAEPRPNATTLYNNTPKTAYVPLLIVDMEGLDSNQTLGNWNPNTTSWDTNNLSISNLSDNIQPIAGPATIRILIKPWSARNTSYTDNYWANSSRGNWDFKASEGYVTFRIVGSEKEISKKFATVIPENSSGNVDIILEQSTDLINWSAVNPGSFPPSTAKRFFRVRSQE
jgi:hypothetical protein